MDNNINIENFENWESGLLTSEDDFFSRSDNGDTAEEGTKSKDVPQEVSKEEVKVGKKRYDKSNKPVEDKVEEEVVVDDSLFDDTDADKAKKADEEVEGKPATKIKTANALEIVSTLKSKGFIDFDLEDGQKLDEDVAEEILEQYEDNYEAAIHKSAEERLSKLPTDLINLNKYVLKGGDFKEFLRKLVNTKSSNISEDIDLDNEENQILVVKEMLKLEGKDNDEIEIELEYLKDHGKMSMMARKKFERWKKENKNEQTELLKRQEEEKHREKELNRQVKQKITEFISNREEVGGFKFSKEDKRYLPTYINDKVIALQNGGYISQMQKELFYDIPQNDVAYLQLALLMRYRNKDGTFNFANIARNVESKITSQIKEDLRRVGGSGVKVKPRLPTKTLFEILN